MSSTLSLLVILLVDQALGFSSSNSPPAKSLTTSAEYTNSDKFTKFLRSSVGLENTTLWFVECDLVPEKTWRDCRFLIGTSSFDNETRWDSCGFQMDNSPNPHHVDSTLRAYRLGSDKYLISWMDFDSTVVDKHSRIPERGRAYLNFVSIEIVKKHKQEIGCKAHDFRTVITYTADNQYQLWQTLTIHLYDNGFDVIYLDSEKGSGKFSRDRFNVEGNRLLGQVDWEQTVVDQGAVTVAPNWVFELTSNDFYTLYSQERLRLTESTGGSVFQNPMVDENLEKLRGWSTSNGLTGLCLASNPGWFTWHCNQTDSGDASGPTSYSFSVRFTYAPQTQMIYNLAGGGLLTMTSDRKKQDRTGKAISSFYLTKFSSNGRGYKPIKFAEIDTSSPMLLGHFFEDNDGNYCFALLHKWGDSTFVVKCFNNEALAQK